MSAGLSAHFQIFIYFIIYFRTLYGYDRCSPAGDRSSSGATCYSQCQASTESDHHHYQCYIDEKSEQREDCGYWYVAGAQKGALEYTNDDQVGYPAMLAECFHPDC